MDLLGTLVESPMEHLMEEQNFSYITGMLYRVGEKKTMEKISMGEN